MASTATLGPSRSTGMSGPYEGLPGSTLGMAGGGGRGLEVNVDGAAERPNSLLPPTLSNWPWMELKIQVLPPGLGARVKVRTLPKLLSSISQALVLGQESSAGGPALPLPMSSLRPCGQEAVAPGPKGGGRTAGTHATLSAWLPPSLGMAPQEGGKGNPRAHSTQSHHSHLPPAPHEHREEAVEQTLTDCLH